jgi:hypothetical protein
MDLFEANTHPFIVKIWIEESAEEAGEATWRGHITHVPSGSRRYISSLGDISAFIVPYLKQMGVQVTTGWQVGQTVPMLGEGERSEKGGGEAAGWD